MAPTGTFTTSDGVAIAYWKAGAGPPLLLAHGGSTDHRCFDPVLDLLAKRYTTISYNRRGYEPSEDNDAGYSLDREADDLVELAGFVGDGEPIAVLGYSYGALAALHAVTTRPAPVRALVGYEPPFEVPGMMPVYDEILELVNQERYEDALRLFLGRACHLSDGVLNAMARHPMWQVSIGVVVNMRRELPVVRSAASLPEPVGRVGTDLAERVERDPYRAPPTRILVAEVGGNPAFRDAAALVQKAIPGTEVVPIPGLPHFAMATEPETFVSRVTEHLDRN